MLPADLVATAQLLAEAQGPGALRQSDLKRAQSTAYYALFHALCRNCADTWVGTINSNRSNRAWQQAYRAINHGPARSKCGNKEVMNEFPESIREFAATFVDMQIERTLADYDPATRLRRYEVLNNIRKVELALERFRDSDTRDKTAFTVWVTIQKR